MRHSARCRSPTARRYRPRTSTPPSRISRRRCPAREADMKARKTRALVFALLAATTLVVAACGSSNPQPMTSTAPMNSAPVISGIVDKSIDQDSTLSVDFGVQDQETAADALKVSAVANDG